MNNTINCDIYYIVSRDMIGQEIRLKPCLHSLLGGVSWRDSVLSVESLSLRRSSVSSVGSGSDSDDSGVNGTGDTVVQLVVSLWKSVFGVDRGFRHVSDSGSFDDVSDGHSLDSLVLRDTLGTVDTSDRLDVTSTLLVSTVGSSLLWHFGYTFVDLLVLQARLFRSL